MKKRFVGLLLFINLILMFVGGVIFHALEHPTEEKKIRQSEQNYEELKLTILGMYSKTSTL